MLAIRPGHIAQLVLEADFREMYSCTFVWFDSTIKITTLKPTK